MAQRVKEGGHNIPKDVIFRRYFAGLKNLFEIYMPIVDYWVLVDNISSPPRKIAYGSKNKIEVIDNKTFNILKEYKDGRYI